MTRMVMTIKYKQKIYSLKENQLTMLFIAREYLFCLKVYSQQFNVLNQKKDSA